MMNIVKKLGKTTQDVSRQKFEIKRRMEIEHFLNGLRLWYVLFFGVALFAASGYVVAPFEHLLVFVSIALVYSVYRFLRPVNPNYAQHFLLNTDYPDFVFVTFLIYFSGGFSSVFFAALIFPLVTGLVRFGVAGGILGLSVIAIVLLLMTLIDTAVVTFPPYLGLLSDFGVLFFVFWVVAVLVRKEEGLREKIYSSSITDALTGAYNASYLRERVNEELLLSYRHKDNTFTIAFIDLNGFKKINDTYGHAVGDEVLIHIVDILRKNTRGNEVLARYGGDEFIIFLPRTTKEEAEKLAQRAAKELSSSPYIMKNDKIALSFSVGVAGYPEDGYNLDEIMMAADQKMYEQKKAEKKMASSNGIGASS